MALAYAISGRLGLLLAVPPGYATALWIPSGLALVAVLARGSRMLPGVYLGSFLANLWISFANGDTHSALLLSALIAAGATFQAWVGAACSRALVPPSFESATPHQMTRLILIAGPLTCLLNPTWGQLVLWCSGHIKLEQIPLSWAMWWIGDAIGVMLVLPLYLATLAATSRQRRHYLLFIGTPALIAVTSAVALFFRSSDFEQRSVMNDFRTQVTGVMRAFDHGMERYSDTLAILHGRMSATPEMDDAAFHRLASILLPLYPGLHALEWAPRVAFTGRQTFVDATRRFDPDFSIAAYPRGASPALTHGEQADVYPLRFREPTTGNSQLIGLDFMTEPVRQQTLTNALTSDRLTVSQPLQLLYTGSNSDSRGIMLMLPVRDKGGTVSGVLMAVLRVSDVLDWLIRPLLNDDMIVTVYDQSMPDQPLFHYGGEPPPHVATIHASGKMAANDPHAWLFAFQPSAKFLADHQSIQSWAALVGCLLGAAGLEIFLAVLTGRNAALAREVNERRRVEAELALQSRALAAARDSAEAANRAKTAFLANMSHEIRTPLGAVLGFSELLADPLLATKERASFAVAVKRNGALLSAVINDILDLAKVEAGKLSVDPTEIRLRDILDDLRSLLTLQAQSKGVDLVLKSEIGLDSCCYTDPLRLRQILLNIVGNAIKFTEVGSVTVSVTAQADAFTFVVDDTGPGITAEQAASLFTPFTQADTSHTRKYGGTGLGLSLSKRLAQLLGGDAVLTASTPGSGSRFTITIASRLSPKSKRDEATPTSGRELRLDGLHVLLVDDVADNRLLVSRYLKTAGAVVETAVNGKEAMHKTETTTFDLVLMDLQMPIMDGYEATAHLRRRGYRAPIIALTAHALKEEREVCLSQGFDEHLSKPVDRQTLLRTMHRVVHPRELF